MTPARAAQVLNISEPLRFCLEMVDSVYLLDRYRAARTQEPPYLDDLGYPTSLKEIDDALSVLMDLRSPSQASSPPLGE